MNDSPLSGDQQPNKKKGVSESSPQEVWGGRERDQLRQDAHEALDDMIQWVAAFAMGNGSHAVLMRSPRMKKAKVVLEKLRVGGGREPSPAGVEGVKHANQD